jgi:hypothetical protein
VTRDLIVTTKTNTCIALYNNRRKNVAKNYKKNIEVKKLLNITRNIAVKKVVLHTDDSCYLEHI